MTEQAASPMLRVTYCAAMSADEFIAAEHGDVSWLDKVESDSSDTHLEALFSNIDSIFMGKETYRFIQHHGSWPYEDKPSWVISSVDMESMPGSQLSCVPSIEIFLTEVTQSGLSHVWLLGGGQLASGFLDKGLITDLILSKFPVVLGGGIPPFSRHVLADIPGKFWQEAEFKAHQRIEIALWC
ncbi:MAG: hypothetical protein CMQ69_03615 [Gammaproteobacteria bacterium]|nr:hypothetical protein [Gammaproteobacteria bacterium]